MASESAQPTRYLSTINSLLDAFIESDRTRARMPAGHRGEIITLLARLMAEPDELASYCSTLRVERTRRGKDLELQLLGLADDDIPESQILATGFVDLTDDQLADYALSPWALEAILESLDNCETLPGEWLFDVIKEVHGRRHGNEARHRAAAEGHGNNGPAGNSEASTRSPSGSWTQIIRMPGRYGRVAMTSGVVAAALLLITLGVQIGVRIDVHESPLAAYVTASKITTRGDERETLLEVSNASARPAFVAVLGLFPDRAPAVFYRQDRKFIQIGPKATRAIQSLPDSFVGAKTLLVIVSPTPLGDAFRDIDAASISSRDLERTVGSLRRELESLGYRGFVVEEPRFVPRGN